MSVGKLTRKTTIEMTEPAGGHLTLQHFHWFVNAMRDGRAPIQTEVKIVAVDSLQGEDYSLCAEWEEVTP